MTLFEIIPIECFIENDYPIRLDTKDRSWSLYKWLGDSPGNWSIHCDDDIVSMWCLPLNSKNLNLDINVLYNMLLSPNNERMKA